MIRTLLFRAVAILRTERRQLLKWAEESMTGGWSTHQVKPMKKRAEYLKKQIVELERKLELL